LFVALKPYLAVRSEGHISRKQVVLGKGIQLATEKEDILSPLIFSLREYVTN